MGRKKPDDIKRKVFLTQLDEKLIKEIKLAAVNRWKLGYQIVEEALKEYFSQEKK